MNKNVFIFAGGFVAGAAACIGALFAVGAEKRKIIFRENKKSPDKKFQETVLDNNYVEETRMTYDHAKDAFAKYASGFDSSKTNTDYSAYSKIAADYSGDDLREEPEKEKTPEQAEGIYVITPDDFNEMGHYSAATLTCYADGVIADDTDHIVDDVIELLGEYWNEDLLGQYEPDVAYIRNDYLMQDFEVVRDLRTYDEAHGEDYD